jgi:hypothetical protein
MYLFQRVRLKLIFMYNFEPFIIHALESTSPSPEAETVISIYLWSYPYGNREYFSIYTCRLMLPLFVVWLLGKWAPRRLPKSCLLMVKSRPSKAGIQRLIDMSWILYFIHLDLLKISPHKYMQAGLPITAVPSYIYIIVGNVRVPPGTTYHLQWNF